MLKLLDFINKNSDWEEKLSREYDIKIRRNEGLVIFCYTMSADFCIDIVRECRGIILDETDNFKPVCVPFFKFANYGEPYADKIDWKSARVQEKIDGSLMKLWCYKGDWRVSTNKTISAETAFTNNNEETFLNLFYRAWENTGKQFNDLNPDYTYMFELVSPQSRVVVPYNETKLYHTGTRNNITLKELNIDIGIEKPKEFSITTIEECIEAAKNLDKYHEGFVVVDKRWRRIKVKSPIYLAIHHLLNNIASEKRVMDLILSGEDAEVVAYFPEYLELFNSVREHLDKFIAHKEQELEKIQNTEFTDQKQLAEFVNQTICPSCLFYFLKGKTNSIREFIYNMRARNVISYLDRFQPDWRGNFLLKE